MKFDTNAEPIENHTLKLVSIIIGLCAADLLLVYDKSLFPISVTDDIPGGALEDTKLCLAKLADVGFSPSQTQDSRTRFAEVGSVVCRQDISASRGKELACSVIGGTVKHDGQRAFTLEVGKSFSAGSLATTASVKIQKGGHGYSVTVENITPFQQLFAKLMKNFRDVKRTATYPGLYQAYNAVQLSSVDADRLLPWATMMWSLRCPPEIAAPSAVPR